MIGGVIAVQSFFILSGFYMALVLSEKYATNCEFLPGAVLPHLLGLLDRVASPPIVVGRFGAQQVLGAILQADWTISSKLLALFSNLFIFGSDLMLFTWPSPTGIQFTSS